MQEKVEALGEASCLSKYRWSNDSVSILQSKLDNDFSSQGMNTFTTDVVNDYEAMIARLEERLIDANDSIKFLKDSIETKSNALSKARTKNDVLSKENEIVQLHNLKLKQKQDAMSKKVMELQGKFKVLLQHFHVYKFDFCLMDRFFQETFEFFSTLGIAMRALKRTRKQMLFRVLMYI